MTHIAFLLLNLLISSSSSLSLSSSSSPSSSLPEWGAAGASVFCTWTKVLSNGEVHYSFLRRGAPSVRLYHSAWSGPTRALLGCSWSDDAAVINNYLSLCQERAQQYSHQLDADLDLDSVLGAEGQCVSLADPGEKPVAKRRRRRNSHGHDERSEVRSHPRVKRGFIVPGTLWCGSGNKAPSYADLGVFSDTDSCCREHDQCKHTILSFHSQFGVFNTNIFTMSHCDCDNKFHHCLKEANDSIADVVGYTFFNLLKMHCFEFSHRLQCTQRNWFGMCKETKMALYAEVHPPTLYESTNPTEVSMNSSITNTTLPADTQLFSVTAAASTVPTPLTSSPSASITPVTNITTSAVTDRPHRPTSTADLQQSCGVYKALDECRNKILPQQRRYGLHNPEPRTLYHCNCTSRLFQTLVKQRQLTEVQTLLMGYVSQSCFLPQDCTTGKTCTAVLVREDLPQQHQRNGAEEVEEQRHLQAVTLKLRRPNSRRAKRKDGAIRLHKLCLRVTRAKQINKNRNMVRVNENSKV
ncbi:hypothetical protein INR49_006952 [Caranx melampygus]|nr:hypothetical protein INR49_006952 [Caranx melampygus]